MATFTPQALDLSKLSSVALHKLIRYCERQRDKFGPNWNKRWHSVSGADAEGSTSYITYDLNARAFVTILAERDQRLRALEHLSADPQFKTWAGTVVREYAATIGGDVAKSRARCQELAFVLRSKYRNEFQAREAVDTIIDLDDEGY